MSQKKNNPPQPHTAAAGVKVPRQPVVAVVGHIDHGKSTLLDYIRKSNVAAGEAGGITQSLCAYEATHQSEQGLKKITFLDTPGHEAFTAMRSRGLSAADVAVLVVSAEDGVKPQTLEAAKLIEAAGIPYVVALTKVDKADVNIERAKASLLEHGIYLEGMGGTAPFVAVSGKTGQGVPELLDLILLAAELQEIATDPGALAEGVIIEAHVEQKRGSSATLIVKNGTLYRGQFVLAGGSFAPVRIMENFLGKSVKEAHAGMPVRIVGFSSPPQVGENFITVSSKKEAESAARTFAQANRKFSPTIAPAPKLAEGEEPPQILLLPLVIKTDAAGAIEAVLHELEKLPRHEGMETQVVLRGVGSISEADVKSAGSGEHPGIILGFNVKIDPSAQSLAERRGVVIATFTIIYKLSEWLGEELEKRRPRKHVEEPVGTAKVLKIFSTMKNKVVLGGRVEEGQLRAGANIKILRRDLELGTGKIESLQSQKAAAKVVERGKEFGAMVKTSAVVAPGDRLQAFEVVYK